MTGILGFFEEYRFLSNFYAAVVELDGLEYSSTEHAYQAAKTLDPAEREVIRTSKKFNEAKRLGKKVTLRPDWEQIKFQVMEDLVRQKFTKHEHLKTMLLETGEQYLEEANNWGDKVWGTCKGVGHNHLGKILMKIREELRF